MDNKGAVDLVNIYILGGRPTHKETRQKYQRELKEQWTSDNRCPVGNDRIYFALL